MQQGEAMPKRLQLHEESPTVQEETAQESPQPSPEPEPTGERAHPNFPDYNDLTADILLYHRIPKGDILLKFRQGPWDGMAKRLPRVKLPDKAYVASLVDVTENSRAAPFTTDTNGFYASRAIVTNSRDVILSWNSGVKEIPIVNPPYYSFNITEHCWLAVLGCSLDVPSEEETQEDTPAAVGECKPAASPVSSSMPAPEKEPSPEKIPCPECGDTDVHHVHVSVEQDSILAGMSQRARDSITIDFKTLTIYKFAVPLIKAGILSLIYQPSTRLFFIMWHHTINQVHYNHEAWLPPSVLLNVPNEGSMEYLKGIASRLAKRINDSLPEKSYPTFKGCNVAGQDEATEENEADACGDILDSNILSKEEERRWAATAEASEDMEERRRKTASTRARRRAAMVAGRRAAMVAEKARGT